MKFIYPILIIGICLNIYSCKNQENFEGIINYKIIYTSYDSTLSTDELQHTYGKSAKFYSKNGNTKWELSDSYYQSVTYLRNKNIIYYLTDTDTILYEDAITNLEKITESRILEEKEDILNYKCNIIKVRSEIKIEGYDPIFRDRIFSYSPKIKLNPSWFLNYNVNTLNEVYSKIGSFPLKIIDEFEFFKIEYIAISIQPKKLKNEIFLINKNLPLVQLN